VKNRGDWIRKKRNDGDDGVVIRSKRDWLKLHLAVDAKTKQVLSMEVTERR
jgi:hypothetical protein